MRQSPPIQPTEVQSFEFMKISADNFALLFMDSSWMRVTIFGEQDSLKSGESPHIEPIEVQSFFDI